MNDTDNDLNAQKEISKIFPKVASPLKLFALVIMICNSTFAAVAALRLRRTALTVATKRHD
jgi:hypothetical protein